MCYKSLQQVAESCKIAPLHPRSCHKQKRPEIAFLGVSRADIRVPGAGLEPARALRLNGF
jgi:hypothetical protein